MLGSNQSQIIAQFIGEALLFVLVALPLAILLAELLLTASPLVSLLSTDLSLTTMLTPGLGLLLLGGALLLGLASGIYPAFFLSSIQPLPAMKGWQRSGRRAGFSRQLLVLTQFTISIVVIASALLMYSQMQFFYNKSLGFDKENKLVLRVRTADVIERLPGLENTFLRNPAVLGTAISNSLPGAGFNILGGPVDNNDGELESRTLNAYSIGDGYLDVMGIPLIIGRSFDRATPADYDNGAIVNETAVTSFGWEEPLGKRVLGREVIGVVADFNFHDLGRAMEPLVLFYDDRDYSESSELSRNRASRYMTVNISGESVFDTVSFIEAAWQEFDPLHPIELRFLDDRLNELYISEQRQMSLIVIFSIICVFISCLGLLGLTAYTTEQRSRELGIRKVLGASSMQLILLLFKNVFFLVLGASVIASVISFLVVSQWLESFAYRIDINNFMFVAAAGFCIVIAFITMAAQSWKTSRSNPADVLRYE